MKKEKMFALNQKTGKQLKNVLSGAILFASVSVTNFASAYVGWRLPTEEANGLPSGTISGILTNLLDWMLGIFAVLGIIGFVLSGIFYLLAGADEGNAEKGKEGMKWSIIGIIVGLSGFIIMKAVDLLLKGNSNAF